MSEIDRIARELVDGMSEQATHKGEKITVNTLCNFGSLGLLTPVDLVRGLFPHEIDKRLSLAEPVIEAARLVSNHRGARHSFDCAITKAPQENLSCTCAADLHNQQVSRLRDALSAYDTAIKENEE